MNRPIAKRFSPNRKDRVIARQEQENDRVKAENAQLRAERDQLRDENESLRRSATIQDAVTCVFDWLKASACNTGNDAWADQLDDLAEEVIEFAPEYKRKWKDILVMTKERDQLRAEVERLRMQLAACGVVAMSNNPESAAKARDMHPNYMSASCQDVMRAVDREMALRAEVESLRGMLREARPAVSAGSRKWGGEHLDELLDRIDAAMAAKESTHEE